MLGSEGATAIEAMEPKHMWPSVTGFQLWPPSVVLNTPPPVPPK
jgi:hypothetical protein